MAKERNLRSYYYEFEPTGVDAVDALLEAIAQTTTPNHGTTPTEIQEAAESVAADIRRLLDAAKGLA